MEVLDLFFQCQELSVRNKLAVQYVSLKERKTARKTIELVERFQKKKQLAFFILSEASG